MLSTWVLLCLGTILASVYAAPLNARNTTEAPALPSSDLPSPGNMNLTLKVIALGVGHQNYTCDPDTGKYGSNVALADLFDVTRYLSKHKDEVGTISKKRLQQFQDANECSQNSDYDPTLRKIGQHFFEPTTPVTPAFNLYALNLFLGAKKVDGVPAPDTADDIDWLFLADNGKGETKGLKAVYRVETAGGRPPATCSGTDQVFIPYVAQYWFYA